MNYGTANVLTHQDAIVLVSTPNAMCFHFSNHLFEEPAVRMQGAAVTRTGQLEKKWTLRMETETKPLSFVGGPVYLPRRLQLRGPGNSHFDVRQLAFPSGGPPEHIMLPTGSAALFVSGICLDSTGTSYACQVFLSGLPLASAKQTNLLERQPSGFVAPLRTTEEWKVIFVILISCLLAVYVNACCAYSVLTGQATLLY
jgi:hypothetical protein